MYLTFIPLWIVAIIVLYADPKSRANHWLSATFFFAGGGGVANLIYTELLPLLQPQRINQEFSMNVLVFIIGIINHIGSGLIFPYCLFMFGLYYSEPYIPVITRFKNVSGIIFLIPVLIIVLLAPFSDYSTYPVYPHVKLTTFLATPYFLLTSVLLIGTCFKVKVVKEKQQCLFTSILLVPSSLANFYLSYISFLAGVNEAWRYNNAVVIFVAVIFVFFAVRYSVWGFSIKFEITHLNSALRTAHAGTQLLNHAIKNEVMTINTCLKLVRNAALTVCDLESADKIETRLETIKNSADRILDMTLKIQQQTRDIILEEAPNSLLEIIEAALDSQKFLLQNRNIMVTKKLPFDVTISCDRMHFYEVLVNIIKNAVEAIHDEGNINIELLRHKKYVILAIQDNGCGIPKDNLKKIFDPFFSTKSKGQNFGLGLSYCFNVMRKHGGYLDLQSTSGKGTTVLLSLPSKRVLNVSNEVLGQGLKSTVRV